MKKLNLRLKILGLKIVEAVHQESPIKDLEEPQVLSLSRLVADVVEAVKENQSPVHPQSQVEEGRLNGLGVQPQLGLDQKMNLNHQTLRVPHRGQGPRGPRKVKMRLCNHQVVVQGEEAVEAAGLKDRPDLEKSSKIFRMKEMKLCPKERDNVQIRVEKVHRVRLQKDVT